MFGGDISTYCHVFPPQVIFHGVPTKSPRPQSVEHTLIEFSLKSADSAERERGKEDENESERILRKTTRGVTLKRNTA